MSQFHYEIVPAFTDNYIFALSEKSHRETSPYVIIVDPGQAAPLTKNLNLRSGKELQIKILITHHHPDHIGGLKELTENFECEVWGPDISLNKIPEIHHRLKGQEQLRLGQFSFEVLKLPGHTLDHLAFYEAHLGWLFSGDVLFRYGCGRLFEGDFSTAFESLQKIKALSDSTLVFCTHEYTAKNLEFSLAWAKKEQNQELINALEEEQLEIHKLLKQGKPTVPFLLGKDKKTNPFLLAKTPEEFRDLRLERNRFT